MLSCNTRFEQQVVSVEQAVFWKQGRWNGIVWDLRNDYGFQASDTEGFAVTFRWAVFHLDR